MYQKIIYSILIVFLFTSCSKKEPETNIPADQDESFTIYNEALEALKSGDLFYPRSLASLDEKRRSFDFEESDIKINVVKEDTFSIK